MKTSKRSFTSCILLLLFTFAAFNIHGQSNEKVDFFKDSKTIDNLLKLTAVGNGYSDQTIVVFIPGATAGFDPSYDAYKLTGIYEAPQLYSIIPCCNLAVNALPEITINFTVKLGFDVGYDTNYTISATELYTFDPSVSIFLDDTRDNVLTDLQTDSIYDFTALTTDDSERFKLYFRYPVKLDLKVFLEGSYNGLDMNTDLNSGGHITLNQPFNVAPWNYAGTESVGAIPNTDISDWVLVEIRDASDAVSAIPGTVVEQAAGFLLKDGLVVGLDGTNYLEFKEPIAQNIFIVVWHRNHLNILSSSSPTEAGGIYSYDFTSGIGQAYNGSLAHKDLGGGIYGMVAGDVDANGTINSDDKTISWENAAGESGYLQSDLDMDGQADHPDKNDVWLINQGYNSQVPN